MKGAAIHSSLLRRGFHKIQKRFSWIPVVSIVISICIELACIGCYVYVDESDPHNALSGVSDYKQSETIFLVQAVLCVFFTLEWVFFLCLEESKLAFLLSLHTVVSIFTSFMMNFCTLLYFMDHDLKRMWIPLYLRIWRVYDHFITLLDYPQLMEALSDPVRETLRNILSLVATMLTCVGTYHAAESFTGEPVHLFESTYFIVVTFGTIGYGDMVPHGATSRVITTVIIIVAVYQFPLFFARLAEIARERPNFTSFSSKKGTFQHVIVCGTLQDRDVSFFLNEFFSGIRRFIQLKIVMLSDVPFSQETRLLASSPGYNQRVTLVIGDPRKRTDLERCDAAYADAIFLVSNDSLGSTFSDYELVMKSMAIHQFDSNLPQHAMLKRERNKKFLEPFVASIMEKERLKTTLLGLGAVLPGVVPLIVNLIRTYDPEFSVVKCRNWKEQLDWAMGNEMYTFTVPPFLVKRLFLRAVKEYSAHSVTIIGLIECNMVVLNPKTEVLDSTSTKLICIAADKAAIDEATKALAGVQRPESDSAEQTAAIESIRYEHGTFGLRSDVSKSVERKTAVEYLTVEEAPKRIRHLKDHVVLVDLSSAHTTPPMSAEAAEEAEHFRAKDLINVTRPLKQQNASTDIVVLTRFKINESFEAIWAGAGFEPVIVINGCGLNMEDLRVCGLETAKGVVVFATGEGNDVNADAMTMLVTFAIEEILREAQHSMNVVTEVQKIESLSLFPPYYTDDSMCSVAEHNFAFEPNFIIGSAICSAMLDPALYQTYFNRDLLKTVDALIYNDGQVAPVSALSVPAHCATYADVIDDCLSLGYIPLGLHRKIEDDVNQDIDGKRFMFTNPPGNVSVTVEDMVYFLT